MKKNSDGINLEEKLEYQSLDYIMSDRFARYSKYIIQQRALPDIRDGLKPVQRRILYSMNDLNLQFDKTYKKSARVVGDVIGKYHPHGDSSIYEALVRMAQDWKMNIPLVEMHGNKGSIDDDPAAAMRYTEVKLSKISSLMLNELEKNTVNFSPNFDDTEKEPTVLPSYIPNLLLNGSRGIASGFATEIPPHNLNELLDATIAKIKNPELSYKSLMKYIKGPDFPTGAIICGNKGIEQAFERGQGRITILSKYEIVKENKNEVIRITEIPYGVVKSKLVRQIDELRINGNINGIKEVRDETDRDGICIAIIIEQDANTQGILNFLLQKTDMKIYYTYNMVSIVDNVPKVLGIDKMLNAYIKHIKEVKRRASIFDLEKNRKRLEIVNGLIKVSQIPDEVIKVIRNANGGKQGVIDDLHTILGFTIIQATAIAELRLYRLNKTDVSIYYKEKEELEEKIKYLNLILNNEEEFDKYIISIFKQIKKEYGIDRKTQIEEEELLINVKQEELIKPEMCWVSFSKDGYLKRFSNRIYELNDVEKFGIKENDKIIYFNKSNTTNKLLIFTSSGDYVLIPIHKINESKWKDEGQHISDFVQMNSKDNFISVIDVSSFDVKAYIILITKMGIGKRILLKDLEASRTSKTLKAISFKKKNDELVNVKVSNGQEDVFITTNTSHSIRISENEIPILSPRASGNTLIKVEHNWVSAFGVANNDDWMILLMGNNSYKTIKMSLIAFSSRSTKGLQLMKNIDSKHIIRDIIKNDEKIKFVNNKTNNSIELVNEFKLKTNINNNFVDQNSSKISKNNGVIFPIYTYQIDLENPYFIQKKEKIEVESYMKKAEDKINKTFEENEEKIKKIDDILKKIKI